jgi:hypothetical protein
MNAKKPPETESFDAAELGAMMREMRENLGHELDAVARDLRIRLVYLEAIESGRLSDLPGNAYVSGFLRSYSDFLGLEGEEIVRRFKMAGAEISNQPTPASPALSGRGRTPSHGLYSSCCRCYRRRCIWRLVLHVRLRQRSDGDGRESAEGIIDPGR